MTRCWVLPWNGIVGHVIQQCKDIIFIKYKKKDKIRNKNNKIR